MEGRTVLGARVVDQNLDRAEGRLDLGHRGLHRSGVTDVERPLVHLQAFTAQLLRGGSQPGRVAPVEHHGGAGLRQAPRHTQADACGGAGDQGQAAVESKGIGSDHAVKAPRDCAARWARASGGSVMSSSRGCSSAEGASSV